MRQKSMALLFAALCVICVIFLLRAPFNYSLHVPSSYRIIYIPLYFWILYAFYFLATSILFLRKTPFIASYIKEGVVAVFFLHIYLLLGNLINQLFANQGLISGMYQFYIKFIFCIFTALIIFASVKFISIAAADKMREILIYSQYIFCAAWFFISNIFSHHVNFAISMALFAAAGWGANFICFKIKTIGPKEFFLKDSRVIITVFLIAFVARAAFGVVLVNKTISGPKGYDGYLYASDDGLTYDATANKILEDPSLLKAGHVEIWGHWDQFYSIFLALLYKIFGRNFYMLVTIQAFFGAFVPVFIFLIGRLLFQRPVALIAAFLLALKGGIIMLSSYMGHEAIWLPLLYLFILLLTFYFKKQGLLRAFYDVLMGLVLGILALFRSLYFYLLPYLCVWELLFFRKIRITKRMTHLAVITALSLSMVFGAFGIFNNKMKPINSEKAQILWHGSRLVPPFQYLGNERLDAIGVNYLCDPKGFIKTIVQRPFEFLILAAKIYPLRVVAYLETYQFGWFDPIYMLNPANIKNAFASTLEFYFTCFFIIGLVACFFRRGIVSSPIFLILSFHIIFFSLVIFQASPRIKEISSPIMYLIGSFGAYNFFNFLTKKIEVSTSGIYSKHQKDVS